MVKMAKMKTGRCGENLQRPFSWGGRWTDAEKTKEALCLSGLSQPDGWTVLPGASEQSEQRI